MHGWVLVDWSEVEVRFEVLLPATVLLTASVVGRDPSSMVKDVDEPEEVADETKPETSEPLTTAIVVASNAVSPLRLPEARVVVDVRL